MEDEDKGDIPKSCEDKEVKVTMRSIQARERFSKCWESCSKNSYLSKGRQIFGQKSLESPGVDFFAVLFFVAVLTILEILFFTPKK